MNWVKIVLIGIALIVVDLAVYILFGLLLMNYEDFYDESEGEYWSWASMNTSEQLTVVGLNIWNLVNILALIYLIYRTRKLIKSRCKNVLQQYV